MRKGIALVLVVVIAFSTFTILPLAHGNDGRINVVATLQIYSFFAERIGGNRVNVTYIVPQGEDIHSYSLKYEDIQKLNHATLVILASSEFFALDKNIKEKIQGKEVLDFPDYNATLYPLGDMERNVHGYWLYPPNVLNISRAIENKLEKMDPQHRDYYEKNLMSFQEEIKNTMERVNLLAKESGLQNKNVLLTVPGVFYMVKTLGINIEGTILKGPHQFISESELKAVKMEIENGNISYIVNVEGMESSKAGQIAIQLSRETGVRIVYIDIFSTDNYTSLLLKDASILAGANYVHSYGMENCHYGFYIVSMILILVIAVFISYIAYRYRKELLK